MRKYIYISLFSLLLLSGCVTTDFSNDQFQSIPAFYKVNNTLYRGGEPDMDGLVRLKDMNIKTILSFQQDEDDVANERAMVHAFGMEFYNIPLIAGQLPTEEQAFQFLKTATNQKNFPVFIHCDSGRTNTGIMMAIYRVIVDGWPANEAYQEAKNLGFWPYKTDAELKAFIQQLRETYTIEVNRKPVGS